MNELDIRDIELRIADLDSGSMKLELDNRTFEIQNYIRLSNPLKYIVGNSSMMTDDFSIPFLLMSFTIRELYRPSAAP